MSNEVAEVKNQGIAVTKNSIVIPTERTFNALMANPQIYCMLEGMAKMMASGRSTVPKHLQGNEGDCLAVTIQAWIWGLIPNVVAQKTHIVNGALGYESQLVNAVVCNSKLIKGRFKYEYRENHGLECRVGATLTGDTEITWNEWLNITDVKIQNSPLWKSNPRQQLSYLQIKNWARLYTPDAILGVYATDELEDSSVGQQQTRYTEPKAIQSDVIDVEMERFITPENQKELFNVGKANNLTKEEMSFIVFEKCGVDKTSEILTEDFGALLEAFKTAKSGEVLPSDGGLL